VVDLQNQNIKTDREKIIERDRKPADTDLFLSSLADGLEVEVEEDWILLVLIALACSL
jgi:hypothetical protein